MRAALRPFREDPALGLSAALMLLFGSYAATMAPYSSALAVSHFGLSERAYALVLVVASVVAVSASVGLGILADQRANRRGIALFSGAMLALGLGLVLALRTPLAFVLAAALILPLSGSIFGQLFALARLAASTRPEPERPAIQATLRAVFALPWVLVLPVWALVFRGGAPLMAVYPVGLALALGFLALSWLFWPRDGATRWPDPKSGLSFRQSLREIGQPAVLVRVLALGPVHGSVMLYMVVLGLVFTATPGRGAGDVALYAGLLGGVEVPFMLALPRLIGRLPRQAMIFAGMALYALHLAGLPLLADTPFVWALIVPGAMGGAVILTQPMAYLQDLMAARPGAGASLMALQKLAGDAICAGTFALGTWIAGYQLAAAMGAVLALAGAGALWALDRRAGAGPGV
ncbi:MAG: MFS transporter [Paracoccaceae bacterium]|jgi:predicted MFS family arabinose efflux permease